MTLPPLCITKRVASSTVPLVMTVGELDFLPGTNKLLDLISPTPKVFERT